MTQVLTALHERGVNVFDQSYEHFPDPNPKRFTHDYDSQCDKELTLDLRPASHATSQA